MTEWLTEKLTVIWRLRWFLINLKPSVDDFRVHDDHVKNSKCAKFLQQKAATNATIRIWFYCKRARKRRAAAQAKLEKAYAEERQQPQHLPLQQPQQQPLQQLPLQQLPLQQLPLEQPRQERPAGSLMPKRRKITAKVTAKAEMQINILISNKLINILLLPISISIL